MPTRVIDVGEPQEGRPPRLIITRGLRQGYLALSYCWGPATETFTLNENTMADMLEAVSEADLTRTHREVIQLARSLRIRFVWIDALCIIQGNSADWEHESRQMARVYGNAELTVIAGRSADARDGFINNDLRAAADPCAIPVGASIPEECVFASLPRSQKFGPVETRGWCFQENLLSPRALVFGKEQLIFQCRTHVVYEDGSATPHGSAPTFLQPVLFSSLGDRTKQREMTLKRWYELLDQFTMRALSNPHDIFAAIASIAELAQRILGSRYLAGVWEDDIVRGLLWKPRHHVQLTFGPIKRPYPTRLATAPVIRAPSWSWAAVEGPLLHKERKSYQYTYSSFAKVRPILRDSGRWSANLNCDVSTLHMPSCELQFKGYLARAAVSLKPIAESVSVPENWKNFKAHGGYSVAKLRRHGCLLVPHAGVTGALTTDLDRAVAIGLFDIADERCDDIWCLLLIPDEGLLLRKRQDGCFHRMGWFLLMETGWFEGREEVEVTLA